MILVPADGSAGCIQVKENIAVCPFADRVESPCAGRITLENIIQVYVQCANDFQACPIYQELLADERRHQERLSVNTLRAAS